MLKARPVEPDLFRSNFIILYDHAQKCKENGQYVEAKMIGEEALELAIRLNDPNLQTQSCLLLFDTYYLQKDYYNCIDFGSRALIYSSNATSDIKLLSHLRMIELYETLGIPELNLTLIPEAEKCAYTSVLIEELRKFKLHALKSQKFLPDIEKQLIQLLDNAKVSKDHDIVLETLEVIMMCLSDAKRFKEAEKYAEEMKGYAGWAKNAVKLVVANNNLGLINGALSKPENAMFYFDKAISLNKQESPLLVEILLNKAFLYTNQTKYSEAIALLSKAVDIAERGKFYKQQIKALAAQASISLINSENFDAQSLARKALALSTESMTDNYLEEIYLILSEIAKQNGNKELNLKYLTDSKKQAEEKNQRLLSETKERTNFITSIQKTIRAVEIDITATTEQMLREEQVELNDANQKQAFQLLRTEKELRESELERESFAREKAQQELALLESKYISEQQNQEITTLEKEKTEQKLSLANLEIDKQNQASNMKILNQNNAILDTKNKLQAEKAKTSALWVKTSIFGSIVLVLALMATVYAIRRQRKSIATISDQKDIIEQNVVELSVKNNDINKSIEYAQFFQAAIIPEEIELQKRLKNSFIIYKPLDAVSGDLPFIVQRDNFLYVGAIDCIGHGVPAAMLTFMAHYSLLELIDRRGNNILCGDLLLELDQAIKHSLTRQGNSDMYNSGIDLGLCRIDLTERKIQFAGAQIPLYICKPEGVERIKSNVNSLADLLLDKEFPYKTHHFQATGIEHFYLMSDGFNHQFGGETGNQKFSRSRFVTSIHKSYHRGLKEIKKELIVMHDNWKAAQAQTDDILVIGFSL
ncbi:MAG: SpoIIE family protein phosphatase [Flavobacteriales bacterium]|nr:SpoIIE family protein phosphatase [Flavobacteriales bacterium]